MRPFESRYQKLCARRVSPPNPMLIHCTKICQREIRAQRRGFHSCNVWNKYLERSTKFQSLPPRRLRATSCNPPMLVEPLWSLHQIGVSQHIPRLDTCFFMQNALKLHDGHDCGMEEACFDCVSSTWRLTWKHRRLALEDSFSRSLIEFYILQTEKKTHR